jgi:hypothetical protein
MVTPDGLQAAKAELEAEQSRLRSELVELGFGDDGGLNYDANFADTSQVTAERGEAEALAGELKDALSDIEAALIRIDAGTYGVCDRCGAVIPQARLEAMPMAHRCIACATAA